MPLTPPTHPTRHSAKVLLLLLCGFTWHVGCAPTEQRALPPSASPVAERYALECDANDAAACYALGLLYALPSAEAHGLSMDAARGEALLARACSLGDPRGCAPHAPPPPPNFERPAPPPASDGSGTE
jgi:hypothetical protein